MIRSKWVLTVLTAILVSGMSGFASITIDQVRIENLDKVVMEDSFVEAYTSLRAGQELADEAALNEAVAQDVDSLRQSGRVSYVRTYIEKDGETLTLVYTVTPRLQLSQIEVVGAEKIGAKKVRSELGLELGNYVDEALVRQKARELEAYCRKNKYPNAVVTSELISNQATGGMDLIVTVNEGSKLRVKRIRFEGERFVSNERSAQTRRFFERVIPWMKSSVKEGQFEARDLLSVMTQKKTWWKTPWFGGYKPEVVEVDLAALRTFYLNQGYLDVTVEGPDVREIGDGALELVYRIQEGNRYTLGALSFEGVQLFSEEDLRVQMRLNSGEIASKSAIDSAAAAADRYYGNQGYIKNYIRPVIAADSESLTADVRFVVNEGEKAFINEIDIRGNEKTRDEVMRRELAVYPGEMFHQQKVETSENRLRNLNYFETVSSSYTESLSNTNTYDLTFKVKEKAMGSFLVGAGFSSVDNLVGFAEMTHGNFDIKKWPPIGDGQKMKVRVQAGSERKDVEVSFVEPWFLDRKLALGVDLYSRTADYYSDDYELDTVGGRVSLSKPFSPFVRGKLSYSLEDFDVSNVSSDASEVLQEEEGSRVKSTIGFRVTRDTRDQFFIPTRGNQTVLNAEFSGGPLLGDTDIYLLEAKTSHFWPVLKDHVFNLKGSVRVVDGYGGDDVPIFDRLFLGGPRSLRGFEYRDVSPRAYDDPDEPVGGKTSYFMTAEYTIPLWSKIRGAFFYDMGAVNEDSYDFSMGDICADFGLGARFDLPMFPLRLDYAFPIITDSANDDADPRWNFMLGYSF